jgi:hypothetical protein
MGTRFLMAAGLAAVAACASGGKLPVYGNWLITSYHLQQNEGPVPIDVLSRIGLSATVASDHLRLALDRCDNPTYTPHTLTPAEFTERFHLEPSAVDLAANPIEAYDLACGTGDARRTWTVVVKSADALLVPINGTVYELSRTTPGA